MADFYGTLLAAMGYHSSRGNDAWSVIGVTDAKREAALIRASEALDGQYGNRFPGTKTGGRAQVRAWPRAGAKDHCADEEIPADEVPVEIEYAAYALALAEIETPGAIAPTLTMGRVTKREKVDVIEREFFSPDEGVSVNAENLRPIVMAVEDHLRCLLAPKGATQHLLRV